MGCSASSQLDNHQRIEDNRIKAKKENVAAKFDFAAIDAHALNVPTSVCYSVPDLVDYLVKGANNDLQTARSFYRWITENISYDTESLFGPIRRKADADSVLRLRTSVCEGYANLFEEMCKHAGMKVKKISGYSKGYGYDPEILLSYNHGTDHAWNAVYIDNRWQFVECTWGSGYLDNQGNLQKRFDDFYFLTDPIHFIVAHFPYMDDDKEASKQWQLLDKPLTLEEFIMNIQPTESAMKWGLKFSHNQAVINVDKMIEIEIEDPEKKLSISKVDLSHFSGKNYSTYTYLHRVQPGRYKAKVKIPLPGKFKLDFFGTTDMEKSILDQLITYILQCSTVDSNVLPYPEIFPDAQRYSCELLEPIVGILPAKTTVKIKFRSPKIVQGVIGNTELTNKHDIWEAKVITPSAGNSLQVFGSNKYSLSYRALYAFEIR